jgi:predicted DNA-binding transcriptional regulator YafY
MAAKLKVNQAIRENKKISFRYQKFTIKDRTQQVDRRGGATYKISPFKLIMSDGYYYVLAWNAQRGSTITFRLDRMKGVEILNEPGEGSMEFSKINMEAYTQQHFGMFSGEKKRVSLRLPQDGKDRIAAGFGKLNRSLRRA